MGMKDSRTKRSSLKRWVVVLSCIFVWSACGQTGQDELRNSAGSPRKAAGSSLQKTFGARLKTAAGADVSSAVLSGKLVAIYFSAHWCPPCRQFTPILVDTYTRLKSQGKPFEVVFVSFDDSEAEMYEYMREARMPWYALPPDSSAADRLRSKFSVTGIPTLVVVDQNGNTVSTSARAEVMAERERVWNSWAR